jgi:hypothetical protein
MADFRHFLELARRLLIRGIRRLGRQIHERGKTDMHLLNNKLAAAAFSFAFSLVMFATAIAPANGGMLLPGALA